MLTVVAILFNGEQFSDWGFTFALGATFFFASAGASSAYLTVSEIFPMEVRALAIAFFYAIGTAIGGITGPQVFERLGSSGDPGQVAIGYLVGAAVMAIGGVVELVLGVRAEQRKLEDIALPITAEEAERGEEPAPAAVPGEDAEAARRGEEIARRHRERAARERAGLRRLRPGPGSASFSPFIGQPPPITDPGWVDEEIEIIARALAEHGQLSREELGRRVGARYWGPGRFRGALREALAEGAARRVGRNLYAADPDLAGHGTAPAGGQLT
jgi:hypothetical protein